MSNNAVCIGYPDEPEREMYRLKPVACLGAFERCGLLSLLIVPWIWSYCQLRATEYFLSTHRLRISYGILCRITSEVKLYQYKDVIKKHPFWLRWSKVAHLYIYISDRNDRLVLVILETIPDYEKITEKIRRHGL